MYIIRNIIIHRRTSSIVLTRGLSALLFFLFFYFFFSSSTTDTTGLSLDNCCTAPFLQILLIALLSQFQKKLLTFLASLPLNQLHNPQLFRRRYFTTAACINNCNFINVTKRTCNFLRITWKHFKNHIHNCRLAI